MNNKNEEQKPITPKAQEAVVIGKIKQEKERGPMGILIFFGLLVLFAIFLPNITEFVNDYFNPNPEDVLISDDDNDQNKDNDDTQEVIYYDIVSDTTFNVNGLIFKNFSKVGNILSFDVENSKASSYSFKNDNYYIELYDATNMLLERIRINDTSIISGSSSISLLFNIKDNSAAKLTIIEIKDENYPVISLEEDDNKLSTLICGNDESNTTYTFKEGKLNKFSEFVNISNINTNYNLLIEKYRSLNAKYFTTNGIEASFVEGESNFTFSMAVDYSVTYTTSLDELKYYKKDTESKVVKFELETSGYSCS